MSILNHQKKICKKFGLSYEPCDIEQYLYISESVKEGKFPIEWKRYIEEGDFCGWYIWSGEKLLDNESYTKVSLNNIDEYSKELIKFLWLERGTRFIIEDDDYIEAEFDYRVFNMIDNNYD